MVSGRRHNADDLVATALAVEPVKTVYRGRWDINWALLAWHWRSSFSDVHAHISNHCSSLNPPAAGCVSSFLCCPSSRIAVFSVTVFYDERIVIVAEQRPDASEEDSFQWMSRVLQVNFQLLLYSYCTTFSVSWCYQLIFHPYKTVTFFLVKAIDSIHQVGLYCLALVPANTLPKTPLGGIHICETKQNFLEGNLHPCNILMCPHTCVTNLPKPRQKQPGRLTQAVSAVSQPWKPCTPTAT